MDLPCTPDKPSPGSDLDRYGRLRTDRWPVEIWGAEVPSAAVGGSANAGLSEYRGLTGVGPRQGNANSNRTGSGLGEPQILLLNVRPEPFGDCARAVQDVTVCPPIGGPSMMPQDRGREGLRLSGAAQVLAAPSSDARSIAITCPTWPGDTSTFLASDPSDGPTFSLDSSRSMRRPAFANPTRSSRCSIDVEQSHSCRYDRS